MHLWQGHASCHPRQPAQNGRSRDAPAHITCYSICICLTSTSTFLSSSNLFISPYAAVRLRTGTICPQCVSNYTPLQIKLLGNVASAGVCMCAQLCCFSTFRIRFHPKLISAEYLEYSGWAPKLHYIWQAIRLSIILIYSFFLSFFLLQSFKGSGGKWIHCVLILQQRPLTNCGANPDILSPVEHQTKTCA